MKQKGDRTSTGSGHNFGTIIITENPNSCKYLQNFRKLVQYPSISVINHHSIARSLAWLISTSSH